jgi:hypothetical protein
VVEEGLWVVIEMKPLERARVLWDVLTGGESYAESILVNKAEFLKVVSGALNQSALAEREACAKTADTCRHDDPSMHATSFVRGVIAAAIRARGKEGT